MKTDSEALAKSITWSASKQAATIASFMVDKHLVNDFYRAYAYFRWADDVIDKQCQSAEERRAFIIKQKKLLKQLYLGEKYGDVLPEEEIMVDLIKNNNGNDLLHSYIRNLVSTIEFDAKRDGRLISTEELNQYSDYIGEGVTNLLLYCIGNDYNYPNDKNKYHAVVASHIIHMLRDYRGDVDNGYVNIQKEYLDAHGIDPKDVENPAFRNWVKERVELAKTYFKEGKEYIDNVDVLRYKIMAYWYCARFETILDTIEKDNYILRTEYNNRRNPLLWLKMAYLIPKVTVQHLIRIRK